MITRALLVFLCVSCFTFTFAQYNDFGSWNRISFKRKLVKKVKMDFDGQVRLNENASQVYSFFTDLGLSYEFIKNSKVFLSYRLGQKRRLEGNYLPFHRFSLGFSTKKNVNDWKLGYRFKIQRANNHLYAQDSYLGLTSSFRNKISVTRKIIKKTNLWSSYELFSAIDQDHVLYLSDWRWKMGVDRKIKKRQYFSLGFMVQRELNNSNPVTDYVLLVGYEFELKMRKKEKKNQEVLDGHQD